MENKLKLLYGLQKVDSELQEVHELKGDLPGIVDGLQQKYNELAQKQKELTALIKQTKVERDQADVEIIDLQEKVEKYKGQQLHVKSNKQYDALTKEIEIAEERSVKLEKQMELFEGRMQLAKTDLEATSALVTEASAELDEKKKELKEINKEHEDVENKLRHEREKILVRIDKADLERYERIRKAKAGMAIVPVRRGACGGCFKSVPPQRVLEIRQNTKLFVCEHCGRILVSDQIVEMSSTLS